MRVHESWHYEKFAVCVRLSQGRFLLSISSMTQCFRTTLSNEVCGYKIIMKIVLKIGKFYCPELKEANLHQKLWKERKITGVYLEKQFLQNNITPPNPDNNLGLFLFSSLSPFLFFLSFFFFMLDPPSQFLFPEMHAVMKMAKFVKPAKLISL